MLAERLKTCRKKKNVTQKEVAQFLSISERAYQHYELSTSKPSYDILLSLADYFDVSIDYLVGRSEKP